MKNKKILIISCSIVLVIVIVISGVAIHNYIKQNQYLEEQDALVNENDITNGQNNTNTNTNTDNNANTEEDKNAENTNNVVNNNTNYVAPKPVNNVPVSNEQPAQEVVPVVPPVVIPETPIIDLDKVKPVATLSVNGTNGFVKSIATNITATDNIAVSKIKYAISTSNAVQPTDYTVVSGANASVSFPSAGNNNVYYIWYYAVDIFGNSSELKVSAPFKIDNQLPIANINSQGTGSYVKSASATITATDNLSTISKIMYKVVLSSDLAEPTVYNEVSNTNVVVNFPTEGDNAQYCIWYYTVDSANNASVPVKTTGTFKLDNTAPTVDISSQGTDTFVKTATTTITAADSNSTISKIMYKVVSASNAEQPTIFDEAANVSELTLNFPAAGNNDEYYVWYYAIDGLGNASVPVRTTNTFKIDNETPVATIDMQGTASFVKSVSATITATDGVSPISKIMYKVVLSSDLVQPTVYNEVSNSTATISFPTAGDNAQYCIWYYTVDSANNASAPVKTSGTFKIDNIAPQLDLVNYPISMSMNVLYNNDGTNHIEIEGVGDTATNEPIDNVNLRVFLEVRDNLGNIITPKDQLVAIPNEIPIFSDIYRTNYTYTEGTNAFLSLWVEDLAGNRTYIFNNASKVL